MEFIDPNENPHAYKYAFALVIIEHLKVLEKLGSLQMVMKEYSPVSASTVDYMHCLKVASDYFMPAVAKKHRDDDVNSSSKWGYPAGALSYNFFSLLLGGPQDPTPQTTEQLLTDAYNNVDPPFEVWNRERELGDVLYPTFKSSFQKALKSHGEMSPDTKKSQIVAAYLVKLKQVCKSMDSPAAQYVSHVEKLAEQFGPLKQEHFTLLEDQYEIFVDSLHSYLEFLSNKHHAHTRSNKSLILSLREKGNNLMANSSFAQSIQIYTNAIDFAQGDAANQVPQLLVNRAIAYVGLNCFVEAIADLNHAIALDRTFSPAWIQLGYAQLYMGNSLVAFRCYTTAFACMAGRLIPYDFPQEPSLIKNYRENCLQSILPQFVYQLLKSVKLVEQRASQQRFDSIEINKVRAYLIDILNEMKAAMPPEEQGCCTYPPVEPDEASFRSLAERVNRSRPGILTHEVAQGILASGATASSRRGPVIAVETMRPAPVSFQVNPTLPDNDTTPSTDATEPEVLPPSVSDVRSMLNSFDESMGASVQRPRGRDGPRDATRPTSTPSSSTEEASRESQANGVRPLPGDRVRRTLNEILPDFLSQGLSNVLSQSFRGNGGTGEFVFASGLNNQTIPQTPTGPANESPNSPTQARPGNTASPPDQDEEMSPQDLD